MQRRLWLLVGAAVAVMILALSASAMTKVSGSSRASALAAAPFAQAWANVPKTTAGRKAKSVLVFGGEQDPAGFNGLQATQSSFWAVMEGNTPVIRGTYIIDNKGQYHLDVASSVTATKTDLTITIRPGAVWNWGGKKVPVSPADFAYTWKEIVDPKNQAASTTGYDQIAGYTIKGARTIVFHWKPGLPFADYRDLFGSGSLYPSKALAGLDWNTLWANCVCGNDGKPVSNGPFMLTNWTKGQGVTLKSNPFWYGTKPGLKEIDFKLLTDTNSEIQAMRGGEVDAIFPSPQTALSELVHQSGLTYNATPGFVLEHVDIQTGPHGNPLLKQPWMRQAIALAINRHSLINAIFSSYSPGQKPLNNLEYLIGPDSVPHFAKWNTAPKKALALLKAHCTGGPATPTRGNTSYWTCNGTQASFRWFTTVGNQRRATSEAIFEQQLGAIGIKINPTFMPGPPVLFGKVLPSHDFDLAEYAAVFGSPDPSTQDATFTTGAGQNYTSYSNPTVDKLIAAGEKDLNPTSRKATFEKIDTILANDLPQFPLYNSPVILVHKSAVKGMEQSNNPVSEGPTWNAEAWHW
jgi:peptide/nickel transport system substrate-binding protein